MIKIRQQTHSLSPREKTVLHEEGKRGDFLGTDKTTQSTKLGKPRDLQQIIEFWYQDQWDEHLLRW